MSQQRQIKCVWELLTAAQAATGMLKVHYVVLGRRENDSVTDFHDAKTDVANTVYTVLFY